MSKALIIDESNKDLVELVREQLVSGASIIELKYFCAVCNRLGLDPFAREIYAVPRWDNRKKKYVLAVQVGVDGFRLVAQRSGRYRGISNPEWCGRDGVWTDIWLKDEPPFACRIYGFHEDFEKPIMGLVKYSMVVQTTKEGEPNSFWKKMPDHMMAKCAEVQMLRKAFATNFVGIYSDDEMPEENPLEATLEHSKKDFDRMNRIQESLKDVTPTQPMASKEALVSPPSDDSKAEQAPSVDSKPSKTPPQSSTSDNINQTKANQQPEAEPNNENKIVGRFRQPRNMALGAYVVKQGGGPLSKWPNIGKVPEREAKTWILQMETYLEKNPGAKITPEASEAFENIKAFWGV